MKYGKKREPKSQREDKVKEIPNHFQRMEMLNASRIQHLEHGFISKWHQYASACNVQVHNSIQCANERYNGTFYSRLSKYWVWEIELLSHTLFCVAMCACLCVLVRPSVRLSVFVFWLWILSCIHHTQPQTKYNTAYCVDFSFLAKWTKVKLLNFTVHFRVHVLQFIFVLDYMAISNCSFSYLTFHQCADFIQLNSIISICKYWKFVSIKFLLNERTGSV